MFGIEFLNPDILALGGEDARAPNRYGDVALPSKRIALESFDRLAKTHVLDEFQKLEHIAPTVATEAEKVLIIGVDGKAGIGVVVSGQRTVSLQGPA